MKLIKLCLLSLALLLTGCATTQTLETAKFEAGDNQLTDIRLYIDDGTGGNGNAYSYDYNMVEHFKKSGLFRSINERGSPYRIEAFLSTKRNVKNEAAEFTYLMAQAATLFVLPSRENTTFKLDIAVMTPHGNKGYSYEDTREWTMSLLNPESLSWEFGSPQIYAAINNMLDHFFADLSKDGIIPQVNESPTEEKNKELRT